MSILERLEGKSATPIRSSLELFREVYGGWRSNTGQVVTHKTALQVSAVLACARVIGEGVAQVPLKLMREMGAKREPAREHQLYDVLHRKPNPWQTSYEYREMLGMHLAVAGGHYSLINRMPGSGRIAGLYPFEPNDVTVERDPMSRRRKYKVQREGLAPAEFSEEHIWHIPGPSWNGYVGLEIYKLARDAIGLAMATEAQHAKLHKAGAQVSGLLSVEGTLADDKYRQMRAWLDKYFESAEGQRAGGTMILDRGTKFTQMQMTGVDAQHLETRRYQVEEVCRDMRVMPIMVGYSDKATTYASAEAMFLAHLSYTLAPLYQRLEQSIDVHLLTDADRRDGIYADFVEEGLARASAKDTKDLLLGYVNGGLITPNEGRAKLELNPDADPTSDKLRIPQNVAGKPEEPKPDEDAGGRDKREDDEDRKEERALRQAMVERLSAPAPAPVVNVSSPPMKLDLTVGKLEVGESFKEAMRAMQPIVNVAPTPIEVKVEPTPVTVDVHVPPAKVDVKVEPAPVVMPEEIRIKGMPKRKSVSETERDGGGNIKRVTQTEQDA